MSGWTWRAPNEMTGSGAATSTHSRAAVAQPVDWASIPRIAVSYRPNRAVAGADPEDDLLGRDPVAVVERLDLRLGRVASARTWPMQVLRLVDPAQDRVLAGEDLHRDDGVQALALEDALGAGEVDVGRVAGQDLARRPGADEAHQRSWLTMRLPCRRAPASGCSTVRGRRPSSRRSPDGRRV